MLHYILDPLQECQLPGRILQFHALLIGPNPALSTLYRGGHPPEA